jgi:hypothetical protein
MIESGFGRSNHVAKGKDLLKLRESTPISNESECKLHCVLNEVAALTTIFAIGLKQAEQRVLRFSRSLMNLRRRNFL